MPRVRLDQPGEPSSGVERLSPAALRRVFREARRDRELAVLEGLHALKHALRFGAEVTRVALTDRRRLRALAEQLAPDVVERLAADADELSTEDFATLAPQPPATGVIALARRPPYTAAAILGDQREAPVVLLERPRDLGNMGACVRVSAAAEIAGVLSSGSHDPWDPAALRGSAGLHFALPVARLEDPELTRMAGAAPLRGHDRPLIALDPEGDRLRSALLPARAILAFGGERRGLSEELLQNADERVRLPMRAGVSSLNLATSVAALLYAWRLS